MKKISVITINYNNIEGLQLTLESIMSQKGVDFEYLVIDGGSTDGSKELIKKHESNLTYWISEQDTGIYDAMNKGVLMAKGEYLIFINSGDQLAENTTLQQASVNLDPNFEIVYGNLILNQKGVLKEGFMPDVIDLSQMMKDTLWHPVSFIKRELFTKYGLYNSKFKICGDYEFFFNVIVSKKVKTRHIHQFIAIYNLEGISSNLNNVPLILKERELAQNTYLTEKEIADYRAMEKKQTKSSIFARWFR